MTAAAGGRGRARRNATVGRAFADHRSDRQLKDREPPQCHVAESHPEEGRERRRDVPPPPLTCAQRHTRNDRFVVGARVPFGRPDRATTTVGPTSAKVAPCGSSRCLAASAPLLSGSPCGGWWCGAPPPVALVAAAAAAALSCSSSSRSATAFRCASTLRACGRRGDDEPDPAEGGGAQETSHGVAVLWRGGAIEGGGLVTARCVAHARIIDCHTHEGSIDHRLSIGARTHPTPTRRSRARRCEPRRASERASHRNKSTLYNDTMTQRRRSHSLAPARARGGRPWRARPFRARPGSRARAAPRRAHWQRPTHPPQHVRAARTDARRTTTTTSTARRAASLL